MKSINHLAILLIAAIIISSCKKDEVKAIPLASLNVTNAIVDGTTAKLGSNASSISNNAYTQFALKAGHDNIYIYPSTDSLHPYYNNIINTNNGDVYSLFLAGTTAQVDTILIKENIPYRKDSTTGIRFINLAPSSNPISITLSTSTTTDEVSNLAYKQVTDFKSYPALYNSIYTFQIRDASTQAPSNPLATFSLSGSSVPRFANITLVIRQNGSGVSVFRVNNDR